MDMVNNKHNQTNNTIKLRTDIAIGRNESGANALNLVGAGWSTAQYRRF
jgi:hypothetical protein